MHQMELLRRWPYQFRVCSSFGPARLIFMGNASFLYFHLRGNGCAGNLVLQYLLEFQQLPNDLVYDRDYSALVFAAAVLDMAYDSPRPR